MQSISLADYNIYLGEAWEALGSLIEKNGYSKIVVLVDDNTQKHCLPILSTALNRTFETISIPAGEKHKTINTCQSIWEQMMRAKIDRKALCINLGGGVIGDMGGFCASTFKRGMDFVQVPTTLLSQVDASIGGKLGIDFMQVKNSVGIFKNPKAVFVNPIFLDTLSAEELRSGFAEIIKHSLIADAGEWEYIKSIKDLKNIDWMRLIEPSLQIKKRIVEEDPFEKGLRKALNFGHTIGHALEGYALETENPLLHGEAIAIGMVCEAYLSKKQVGLSPIDFDEICQFFKRTYDYWPIPLEKEETFIGLMKNDKKNTAGKINFSLIPQAGQVIVNQSADEASILESLSFYMQHMG